MRFTTTAIPLIVLATAASAAAISTSETATAEATPTPSTTSNPFLPLNDDGTLDVSSIEGHCRCDILCQSCGPIRLDLGCHQECTQCLIAESVREGSTCFDSGDGDDDGDDDSAAFGRLEQVRRAGITGLGVAVGAAMLMLW